MILVLHPPQCHGHSAKLNLGMLLFLKNLFYLFIFLIFGCIGSSLLRAGFL